MKLAELNRALIDLRLSFENCQKNCSSELINETEKKVSQFLNQGGTVLQLAQTFFPKDKKKQENYRENVVKWLTKRADVRSQVQNYLAKRGTISALAAKMINCDCLKKGGSPAILAEGLFENSADQIAFIKEMEDRLLSQK